jgi:hypothetical protein
MSARKKANDLPRLSRFGFYAEMRKDDFGWPMAVIVECPLGVGERAGLLFPVLYQEA